MSDIDRDIDRFHTELCRRLPPNNPITPGSRTETIRNRNTFLVSTFDIKDRYILDGLVRRDESSLFGSAERAQIYHRLSGAYRVSEDFHLPAVNELDTFTIGWLFVLPIQTPTQICGRQPMVHVSR